MDINEIVLRHDLLLMAEAVRKELRDRDIGLDLTLEIEITGQIQTGGLKLSFKADCTKLSGIGVTAGTMSAAATEMLRRMGWESVHKPLLLEAPDAPSARATEGSSAAVDDDMPF